VAGVSHNIHQILASIEERARGSHLHVPPRPPVVALGPLDDGRGQSAGSDGRSTPRSRTRRSISAVKGARPQARSRREWLHRAAVPAEVADADHRGAEVGAIRELAADTKGRGEGHHGSAGAGRTSPVRQAPRTKVSAVTELTRDARVAAKVAGN